MGLADELLNDTTIGEDAEPPRRTQSPIRRVSVAASPPTRQPAVRASHVDSPLLGAGWVHNARAAIMGAADTMTFGYLDEAEAWIDSKVKGISYDAALVRARAKIAEAKDGHETAYLVGQIGGAFVPGTGVLKVGSGLKAGTAAIRAGKTMTQARRVAQLSYAGQTAASGAAAGFLYGTGSADGDVIERLEGGVEGGLWGATGGAVLGAVVVPLARAGGKQIKAAMVRGKSLVFPEEIAPKALPIETPVAAAPHGAAPKSTPPATEIPAVSLVTSAELKAGPQVAGKAADAALERMSEEEVLALANRINAAEMSGTVLTDPHYRSLLHVDLAGTGVSQDAALKSAEAFEEVHDAIFEKAASIAKSRADEGRSVADMVTDGSLMDALEDAQARAVQSDLRDARLAQHATMMSAVRFKQAHAVLSEAVAKNDNALRQSAVDQMIEAVRWYAPGAVIKSSKGRALAELGRDVPFQGEKVWDVDNADDLAERITTTLRDMADADAADLLTRVKSIDDVERIAKVLTDPDEAKAFSAWRRVQQSASNFLRSNALSHATGIFNGASAVINDFFRHDLSRQWAAANMARQGFMPEAQAMRLELAVGRSVYWQAHRQGLAAMLDRIKWDAWDGIEQVARVGWGNGKVGLKASASKAALAAKGVSSGSREYVDRPRAAVRDFAAFDERIKNAGTDPFGMIYGAALRAGAVTLNTVDALGGASMKVFTGAVDEWGKTFIRIKETYAHSARYAAREGLDLGLHGDDLAAHVQSRAKELAEIPSAEIMAEVEAAIGGGASPSDLSGELKFLLARDREVKTEAARTLFIDGPQTDTAAKLGDGLAMLDRAIGALPTLGAARHVEGILFPYIKTPLRLFETAFVDYGPFAARASHIQDVLAKGGPEAQIVAAQAQLGTMAMGLGLVAGLSGSLVLTNGEYGNTKGLDEGPPNHVRIGDAYIEIGRLDPFSVTLAIGGVFGQAMREGWVEETEYDAWQGFEHAMQTAFYASQDSILSKTYLTGLKDVTDIVLGNTPDTATNRMAKLGGEVTRRLIPLAGTSRQLNDTMHGTAPETIGFVDTILRSIPGTWRYQSTRRDILGDPIDGRTAGIAVGLAGTDGEGNAADTVKSTLRDLRIDLTDLRRTDPAGFALTSQELDELKRVRGHEALDAEGRTMREALAELFEEEAFNELPTREQKKDEVANVIRDFNERARALLEERDVTYRAKRVGYSALRDYLSDGMSPADARAAASADAASEGLPAPF